MSRTLCFRLVMGLLALLVWLPMSVSASVGPGEGDFEIDGDFGSTLETDGDISDDGHRTTYVSQGSGKKWEHWNTEVPYTGAYSYKVRCVASPTQDNDRSEQKILSGWHLNDGMRYFSIAFYIPSYCDTDNWLFLCQWWQDPTRQPPLTIAWAQTDDHIYLARRYDDDSYDALYDDGALVKNQWYHFLVAVDFGLDESGYVGLWKMNMATGQWEQKYLNTALTLGWEYQADGTTPAMYDNITWKVGTYRGATDLTTRIYYDNIRYAKYWSILTKNYLMGYHKNVMDLWFDESTGTTAGDDSTYDHDGTLMNGPTWSGGGVANNCLYFDGVNDHVRVPMDTVDFDFGNYMTVSAWFKSSVNQTARGLVVADEYSSTYRYRLYLVSGTEVAFHVRHPDNTVQTVQTTVPSTLLDGDWHHLVGTYNRYATDGNRLKLYCDGYRIQSAAGADKPLLRANNYVYIGKFSGNYFNGYIDEVQLYNYTLTDSDVLSLYSSY